MTLGEKQRKFTRMLADLICWAYDNGYELTLGRGYASAKANAVDNGHPRSLHRQRLAIDLNLFKNGEYLRTTEAHMPLGEYWESIGGTWGGRFEDGNHYSLEHDGMK